jgi:hypothetical protein
MYLDTTMQLAAIRHDELQQAGARRRPTSTARRARTRWARRATREQGVRS